VRIHSFHCRINVLIAFDTTLLDWRGKVVPVMAPNFMTLDKRSHSGVATTHCCRLMIVDFKLTSRNSGILQLLGPTDYHAPAVIFASESRQESAAPGTVPWAPPYHHSCFRVLCMQCATRCCWDALADKTWIRAVMTSFRLFALLRVS